MTGGYGYSVGAPLGAPDTRYPGVQYKHRRAAPALACGVLSVLLFGVLTGVPAILMGRTAVREIDASDGQLAGRGQAITGIVLGLIGCVLSVAWVTYLVVQG
jgi:hypothetical protein